MKEHELEIQAKNFKNVPNADDSQTPYITYRTGRLKSLNNEKPAFSELTYLIDVDLVKEQTPNKNFITYKALINAYECHGIGQKEHGKSHVFLQTFRLDIMVILLSIY